MIDTKAADKAAELAAQAAQAAANAQAAAEIEWLSSCKNVQDISKDRTQAEATRLKSRYITTFGFDAWSKLVTNSSR